VSNKHGGKRQNSGAKQKYGEPTKSVTFRIPESNIKNVKKLVSDYLKTLIEGSKPY
jgi:predicted DNA binding CopG/RHH family protein